MEGAGLFVPHFNYTEGMDIGGVLHLLQQGSKWQYRNESAARFREYSPPLEIFPESSAPIRRCSGQDLHFPFPNESAQLGIFLAQKYRSSTKCGCVQSVSEFSSTTLSISESSLFSSPHCLNMTSILYAVDGFSQQGYSLLLWEEALSPCPGENSCLKCTMPQDRAFVRLSA